MTNVPEYLAGLATIPVLVIAWFLLRMLHAATNWVWRRLHRKLIVRVDLRSDPISFEQLESGDRANTYGKDIARLVKALERSPRFWLIPVLGWVITVSRDVTAAKESPYVEG